MAIGLPITLDDLNMPLLRIANCRACGRWNLLCGCEIERLREIGRQIFRHNVRANQFPEVPGSELRSGELACICPQWLSKKASDEAQ